MSTYLLSHFTSGNTLKRIVSILSQYVFVCRGFLKFETLLIGAGFTKSSAVGQFCYLPRRFYGFEYYRNYWSPCNPYTASEVKIIFDICNKEIVMLYFYFFDYEREFVSEPREFLMWSRLWIQTLIVSDKSYQNYASSLVWPRHWWKRWKTL